MTKDEHPGTAAAEEDEEPPEDEASSAQPEAETYLEAILPGDSEHVSASGCVDEASSSGSSSASSAAAVSGC